MGELLRHQLYVMLHSRACVLLLLAAMVLTAKSSDTVSRPPC